MTRPISNLDTPLTVLTADIQLQALLVDPPAGHTPAPQPADWYEAVFDLLACTHPEACDCKETS